MKTITLDEIAAAWNRIINPGRWAIRTFDQIVRDLARLVPLEVEIGVLTVKIGVSKIRLVDDAIVVTTLMNSVTYVEATEGDLRVRIIDLLARILKPPTS